MFGWRRHGERPDRQHLRGASLSLPTTVVARFGEERKHILKIKSVGADFVGGVAGRFQLQRRVLDVELAD